MVSLLGWCHTLERGVKLGNTWSLGDRRSEMCKIFFPPLPPPFKANEGCQRGYKPMPTRVVEQINAGSFVLRGREHRK